MWHTPPQGKIELGRPSRPTLGYIVLAKGCLLSNGQVATYVIPESARAEFWPTTSESLKRGSHQGQELGRKHVGFQHAIQRGAPGVTTFEGGAGPFFAASLKKLPRLRSCFLPPSAFSQGCSRATSQTRSAKPGWGFRMPRSGESSRPFVRT